MERGGTGDIGGTLSFDSAAAEDRKFVDLLVVGSKGQSIGLEASKQAGEGMTLGGSGW